MRGERLKRQSRSPFLMRFQFTLSRGERLVTLLLFLSGRRISIHALTRRATLYGNWYVCTSFDFNSRSHEESDLSWPPCSFPERNFNSRSHEESDGLSPCSIGCSSKFQFTLSRGERHRKYIHESIILLISIHALTRRATQCS